MIFTVFRADTSIIRETIIQVIFSDHLLLQRKRAIPSTVLDCIKIVRFFVDFEELNEFHEHSQLLRYPSWEFLWVLSFLGLFEQLKQRSYFREMFSASPSFSGWLTLEKLLNFAEKVIAVEKQCSWFDALKAA